MSTTVDKAPKATRCCPTLTDQVLSEDESIELSGLLKSLADPVRIRIVSLILASDEGEICSCDIPVRISRSQPTASHHLKILTDAGILRREQRGKWAWFSLAPGQLQMVGEAFTGACC